MRMSGAPSSNNNNCGSGNHGNLNTTPSQEDCFVEVWAHNMEEEFVRIRRIVQKYPFISMVGGSLIIHVYMYMYVRCD